MKVTAFVLRPSPQNTAGLTTSGRPQLFVVATEGAEKTKIQALGGRTVDAIRTTLRGSSFSGIAVESAEVDGHWLRVQRGADYYLIPSTEVVFIRCDAPANAPAKK
jgi:hypothetical protein